MSQSTVSLLYRECWGNVLVLAFSQELRYGAQLGKVIGSKRAKVDVIEASKTGISYSVLVPPSENG